MPYSITCSTKILTLTMVPFLLILVHILYEFAMMSRVYILLFPQEEETHSRRVRAQMYAFNNTFIKII